MSDRPVLSYHRPAQLSRLTIVRRSLLAFIFVACVAAWLAQGINAIPRQWAYELIMGLVGIAIAIQVVVRPSP